MNTSKESHESVTRNWLARVPVLRWMFPARQPVSSTGEIEPPPRGARAMAIVRWSLLAVLSVCAVTMVLDWAGVLHIHRQIMLAGGYTCAMHPTYQSDKPGDCPICGMTLVPRERVAVLTTAAAPGSARLPRCSAAFGRCVT